MYNCYYPNQCPYCSNMQMYCQPMQNQLPVQYYPYNQDPWEGILQERKDYGPEPIVFNIEKATDMNNTFRTVLWTGKYLQLTLMCINPGEDIGLEIHPHTDQFLRIEEGQGIVRMGDSKNNLDFQRNFHSGYAIIIPAGKWHNIINTGNMPLKLYSIYAPPQHPHGTVHVTKAEAQSAK